MTHADAVNVLEQATSMLQLNRKDHATVLQALRVLAAAAPVQEEAKQEKAE